MSLVGQKVSQSQIRASRCFKVGFTDQDDKEYTKGISGSIDHHFHAVFHQGVASAVAFEPPLDFDWGPRSSACETVARLAIGKG